MMTKYGYEISNSAVEENLKRIINQVYKLLPMREENGEWEKSLATIKEEIAGMNQVLVNEQELVFSLLCKLEGLVFLNKDSDFQLYRKTIFESLNLLVQVKEKCRD